MEQKQEKKQPNLKVNIVFNTIAQLVSYIIPLILAPYVSRVLGAEGVGEYTYYFSLVYYFTIVIMFGFGSYGVKAVAANRNEPERYSVSFWSLLIVRAVFFAITFTVFLLFTFFNWFRVDDPKYMLYFIPVLVANLINIDFFFQGIENFKLITMVQTAINAVYAVCVFVFVKSPEDLVLYTLLKSCISLVVEIILWCFAAKKIKAVPLQKKNFTEILKESFFFFLPTLIMTIGPSIDQTMIGYLSGNSEVGYYEQSLKIVNIIGGLVYAIGGVMYSRVSFLIKQAKYEEANVKITESFHLSALVLFPATIGLICINQYFVPAFFGEDFMPTIPVLYLLSLKLLFSPFSNLIINTYYYPRNKVKFVSILMASSMAVNAATNYPAIKYLGAKGAALTTILLAVVTFTCYIIFSWEEMPVKSILLRLWKPLLSAVIMGGGVYLFNFLLAEKISNNILICVYDVLLGVVLYFGLCLCMKDAILWSAIEKIKGKFHRKENINHD